MVSNVIPINRKRVNRAKVVQVSNSEIRWMAQQLASEKSSPLTPQGQQDILESLGEAGDEYRTTILRLAHEQAKVERELAAKHAEAAAELEAAVYTAFMNGIEEHDIYDLNDEHLSDALQSAIDKVQARA